MAMAYYSCVVVRMHMCEYVDGFAFESGLTALLHHHHTAALS